MKKFEGEFTTESGIEIMTIEDAYIGETVDADYYTARAVDKDGNEYRVYWGIFYRVLEDWAHCKATGETTQYEEDVACDWCDPYKIEQS